MKKLSDLFRNNLQWQVNWKRWQLYYYHRDDDIVSYETGISFHVFVLGPLQFRWMTA